jgi:hypothetical protein
MDFFPQRSLAVLCAYSGTSPVSVSIVQRESPSASKSRITKYASNLADDLLRVDLQGYEAVCDVNLSSERIIGVGQSNLVGRRLNI